MMKTIDIERHAMNDYLTHPTVDSIRDEDLRRSAPRNVGTAERWLSAALGTGLLTYGVTRRSVSGSLLAVTGAGLVQRGWSGHCLLYKWLGLNSAVSRHDEAGVPAQHGRKITRAITINCDSQELYDHWRNFENLPRVLSHLESVEVLDDTRSRWTAKAPLGKKLQWEAEIITDRPGEIISWQSVPESDVETAGSVRFTSPGSGDGTELHVSLKYDPPGGRFVDIVAGLFGQGLDDILREDLRRFKQQMETGEIATNDMRPIASESASA